MEFKRYIERQREWSLRTFGEGKRTEGIVKHIKSELDEIIEADSDFRKLEECIDVIILAMDMTWRLGFEPATIEMALHEKQIINFNRQWPDKSISEANQNEPTYHVKDGNHV